MVRSYPTIKTFVKSVLLTVALSTWISNATAQNLNQKPEDIQNSIAPGTWFSPDQLKALFKGEFSTVWSDSFELIPESELHWPTPDWDPDLNITQSGQLIDHLTSELKKLWIDHPFWVNIPSAWEWTVDIAITKNEKGEVFVKTMYWSEIRYVFVWVESKQNDEDKDKQSDRELSEDNFFNLETSLNLDGDVPLINLLESVLTPEEISRLKDRWINTGHLALKTQQAIDDLRWKWFTWVVKYKIEFENGIDSNLGKRYLILIDGNDELIFKKEI